MPDQKFLLLALRNFVMVMGGTYDLNEVCHQLAEGVTQALGVVGAGVSVADKEGNLQFVTATSGKAVEIEEVQVSTQDGPCVAAFQSQERVVVEDIGATGDWPEYSKKAMKLGLEAIVGHPLSQNGIRLGALDIYDVGPRQWSDDELDVIGVFADMATAYLLRASELAVTKELANQLEAALTSRVLIEQAKGVLSVEHGISVDEAFVLLRTHSQKHNVKLVEVSRAVVEDGMKIGSD